MKIDVFTLVFVVFALGVCITLVGADTVFSEADDTAPNGGATISAVQSTTLNE